MNSDVSIKGDVSPLNLLAYLTMCAALIYLATFYSSGKIIFLPLLLIILIFIGPNSFEYKDKILTYKTLLGIKKSYDISQIIMIDSDVNMFVNDRIVFSSGKSISLGKWGVRNSKKLIKQLQIDLEKYGSSL